MSFRRTVYNIFFRLSPLLIVVLLELALRFLGVGDSLQLFNESDDAQTYQLNSQHYKHYLSEREFDSLDLLLQEFPKIKEDGHYRVFLISDHTLVSAYPDIMNTELIPDIELPNGEKIDVIQLIVPYTNSFAVKQMLKASKKYDPDLSIVFTGQNEFYGLPKKSAWMRDIENYWGINSYVKMKNFRFIQLLDRFLFMKKDIQESFPPLSPDEWLVEADSIEYREIIDYFKRNLKSINKCNSAPIFYVKLPVNIKQPPYRSFFDDKELNDIDFAQECAQLLENGESDILLARWLEDLNAWEPGTAIYYYCKAMIEERNNQSAEAVEDYWKAVKLDAFKVRMDQDIQLAILSSAKQFPNRVIDLEASLNEGSHGPLNCDEHFVNGLELNYISKQLLVELIQHELFDYFLDDKK